MKKKKQKLVGIIFGVAIILVALVLVMRTQFTAFSPQSGGIINYVVLDPNTNWVKTHPYLLEKSNNVIIGDYTITTSFDSMLPTYSCYTPPFGANITGEDKFGCQLWNKPSVNTYQKCNCMGCYEYDSQTDYSTAIGCGTSSFKGKPRGCQTYTCSDYQVTTDNAGGGLKDTNFNYGCYNSVIINKNGNKVYEHNLTQQIGQNFYFDDFSGTLGFDNACVDRGWGSMTGKEWETTTYGSQFQFVPVKKDDIDFVITHATTLEKLKGTVSISEDSAVQGKALYVLVKVTNKNRPVSGRLNIDFEVPTIIGSAKKTETQIIDIPIGSSEVLFEFNDTSKVTDELKITPNLEVLYPTKYLSRVNIPNPSDKKLISSSLLEYLSVGTFQGDTIVIAITPEKVFVEKNVTVVVNNTIYENVVIEKNNTSFQDVFVKNPINDWMIIIIIALIVVVIITFFVRKKK